MRRTIAFSFFLFIFFVSSAFAQDPSTFIARNEVDEFTGEKLIRSHFVEAEVTENINGERVIESLGCVAYTSGRYFLLVDVRSDGWNFLNEDTAYFVIDGRRYKTALETGESDMDTGGSSVLLDERLIVEMNEDLRGALKTAERARMKASSVVFDITPVIDDEVWAVEQVANE